ncbi:MAG TPA: SLC13 family permease [Firmicutes bacterium]|nr:SLC13 family permease [Bacillota bacterium]
MKKYSRQIGFVLGVAVFLILNFTNLPGKISSQGQICLALSMMVVIWWAFQVAQSGFSSGVYLALLAVMGVADYTVIFSAWTSPTVYLVIGAYLIADAVRASGLGERIAYQIILKFVKNFRSTIVSIFIITFILSLLIPHPWPRAFLIMAVMMVLIDSAKIPKEDATKIGFTVFAASVPVSLVFLTGDALISPLAVASSGMELSWLGWFAMMGLPSIVCSILTLILILILFKPSQEIVLDKRTIQEKLTALGKFTNMEIRTMIWLTVAVALWLTDSIHGIHIGWITLLIPMFMSMPIIGGILTPKSWSSVPVHVLIFFTAAMAIGKVGAVTGMNDWIASTIMPPVMPSNMFLFAALMTVIAVIIHMLLGSVIAVMGVAIPAALTATASMELNPLVPTMLIYMAIAAHYVLPFQHLNMLVGSGKENGMYGQAETIRLGLPLTVVMFIVNVFVAIPWWKILGYF